MWRLSHFNERRRHIGAPTWLVTERLAKGAPLLPNLRELIFRWTSPASTEILHLIPPTLRHLDISDDGILVPADEQGEWEAAFRALLSAVVTKLTELDTLAFGVRDFAVGRVSSPLAQLQSLRSIAFGPSDSFDAEKLRALSVLPNLRSAVLGKIDSGWDSAPLVDPPFSGFAQLERLVICDHPLEDHFYDAFSSPRLRTIIVARYTPHLPELFERTCDVWSRRFSALHCISCNFEPMRFASAAVWQASGRAIAPTIKALFDIQLVTELSLTFTPSQFTVSDQDILDISMAWPCLIKLELGVDPSRYGDMPQVPAYHETGEAALFCLAVRCPLLQTLRLDRLAMRDIVMEKIEEVGAKFPAHRRLEHLLFGRVGVEGADYGKGARLVDRWFPNVRVPLAWEQERMDQGVKMFWDAILSCKAEREERAGVSMLEDLGTRASSAKNLA